MHTDIGTHLSHMLFSFSLSYVTVSLGDVCVRVSVRLLYSELSLSPFPCSLSELVKGDGYSFAYAAPGCGSQVIHTSSYTVLFFRGLD